MGVQTVLTASDGAVVVDVPVSVSGMTIRTGEGVVRWSGQEFILAETAAEVESHESFSVHVSGYLAYDRVAESVEVLVDEVVGDGLESMFDFQASQYILVASLFYVEVPPKATTLQDTRVVAYRVLEDSWLSGLSEARRLLAEKRKAVPQ